MIVEDEYRNKRMCERILGERNFRVQSENIFIFRRHWGETRTGSELGRNEEIIRVLTCRRSFHNDMEVIGRGRGEMFR